MENRIRELRKTRHITMQELANNTGIKKSTIASYETRHVNPKNENATILANFFNVTVAYLLGLSDDELLLDPTPELLKLAEKYPSAVKKFNDSEGNEKISFSRSLLEKAQAMEKNNEKNEYLNEQYQAMVKGLYHAGLPLKDIDNQLVFNLVQRLQATLEFNNICTRTRIGEDLPKELSENGFSDLAVFFSKNNQPKEEL